MLKISEKANPNYLAKVVELKNLRKHPNADRLQIATIDFNDIITGLDAQIGMLYVFFPLESQINFEFLKSTDSFDSVLLNKDPLVKGYFGKQGRVKAAKLRGERSMGYIVPVATLNEFFNKNIPWEDYYGQEFDTIDDILLVKKYEVPVKNSGMENKLGKKPRISKLIEGQVMLHVDTTNLRKEVYKINPEDNISITNKLHGTSFHVHNVIVKRKWSVISKILKKFGVKLSETEYDYIFGSRKVIKNQYETQKINDFYDGDLYSLINEEIKEYVPKNWNVYGECVGFTPGGGAIQAKYDYGCEFAKHKIFIYRITVVNPDGHVIELTTHQIKEFCDKNGLNYVPLLYIGPARGLYQDLDENNHWHQDFITRLEKDYATGKCDMCSGDVPKEGMVLRVEKLNYFDSYKLKNFEFLEYETKMLDEGVEDMESSQSEEPVV